MYMCRNYNHWKNKGVKYVRPRIIFGNMYELCTQKLSMGQLFAKFYRENHEPYVGLYSFDAPILLVKDLDLIKRILIQDFDSFHDRSVVQNLKDEKMSKTFLFLSRRPEWESIKDILSPLLSMKKTKMGYQALNVCAKEMIENLEKKIGASGLVELRGTLGECILKYIFQNFFGTYVDFSEEQNYDFKNIVLQMFSGKNFWNDVKVLGGFLVPKWKDVFGLRLIGEEAYLFLRSIFGKIVECRSEAKIKRNDIIDIMVDYFDGTFSHPHITSEAEMLALPVTLMVANFESSLTISLYALLEMAKNPEVQEKLRQEILRAEHENEIIPYDILGQLKYLDQCVSETLRKYPILSCLERRATKNYQIPGTDVIIEKDTPVFISMLGMHYDPEYYPDPEKFDPDRFGPDQDKPRSMSYLPFGDGPRFCLGKVLGLVTVKVILSSVLRKFTLHLSDKTSFEQSKISPLTIPKENTYILFKKLEN